MENYLVLTREGVAGTDVMRGLLKGVPDKDIVALAERYDTEARTALKVDVAPDEAILRRARSGRYNLIVMGVNRRPGDTLFFGNVAAVILREAKASILFISN